MKSPLTLRRHEVPKIHSVRRLLSLLLLYCVTGGSGILGWSTTVEASGPIAIGDTAKAAADTTDLPHRVMAYYFRTTQRCASCRKIEAYTTEAIQTAFRNELEEGRLVFQVINVEEKGNEHFVKDYGLFSKSVVIADERMGKQAAWKNLPKIWELLGDKEEFVRYVQMETRAYLTGKPL